VSPTASHAALWFYPVPDGSEKHSSEVQKNDTGKPRADRPNITIWMVGSK